MSKALQQLIQLFDLTPQGKGVFQGQSQDLGLPQVFGGQVMAQSLAAAMAVVEKDRFVHSCHSYFLQAGSAKLPIDYHTEILRQGNSFTVVSITAKQQNETLLRMTASFQIDEQGFEHQCEMPQAGIEQFYAETDLMAQLALMLPPQLQPLFSTERAFDVRLKYPNNPFKGQKLPSMQQLWVKANGNEKLDRCVQQCLLAYFSDFHCITTMLHKHEIGVFEQKARFATLDHSIYFHREFDFNQWLFFDIQSPTASGARGLAEGRVFSQDGKLVASYAQEGLIRPI